MLYYLKNRYRNRKNKVKIQKRLSNNLLFLPQDKLRFNNNNNNKKIIKLASNNA